MRVVFANQLNKFVDKFIVGFSTNTIFLPSLSSTKTRTEIFGRNATYDVETIVQETFVVCTNIEGNTEGFGRVNPTD